MKNLGQVTEDKDIANKENLDDKINKTDFNTANRIVNGVTLNKVSIQGGVTGYGIGLDYDESYYFQGNKQSYTNSNNYIEAGNNITITENEDGMPIINATQPTVNNSTITLTQGGVTKGSFTTNQSGNTTIDFDAGGSSVSIDNSSITTNSSSQIQAVGVIDQKTGNANKEWTGTLAEYNALSTHDSNTIYNITDDNGGGTTMTVLWTNDNPTSAVAENTTITLNSGNYDYLIVEHKVWAGSTTQGLGLTNINYNGGAGDSYLIGAETNLLFTRRASFNSKTSITFGNGYGGSSANASYLIPIRVIGVKFL